MFATLCPFPLVVDRPRCSTSWPVWTRRTVLVASGLVYVSLRRLLFFSCCVDPACRCATTGAMVRLFLLRSSLTWAVACAGWFCSSRHVVFSSIVGWLVPRLSSTVAWPVLLVLTHLALCWHSRSVPFYCRWPSWTCCSRPSLCNDRCRIWSGQCAALPVETPQVQFLDNVIVCFTGAVVQTVLCLEVRFRRCSSSSRSLTSPSLR